MTSRPWLALFFASFLSAACDPSTGVQCGDGQCRARQRCDAPTQLCVRDDSPLITIQSPTRDEVVPRTSVTLSGEVHDDAGPVAFVEWTVDNGLTWSRVLTDDVGAFSAVVPLGAVDGAETWVTVRASDSAEQQSAASVRFIADAVAPRCAIVSPAAGACVSQAGGFVIHALVEDGAASPGARLTLDGVELPSRVDAHGQVSADWTAPVEDGVSHELKLEGRDAAGNTCEAQASFSVDARGPVLEISGPKAGVVFGPKTEPLTVHGSAIDHAPGAVAVSVKASWEAASTAATVSGPEWVRTIPIPPGIDFQDQHIVVTATDAAGNTSSAALDVVIDSVAPALTINTPGGKTVFAAADFGASDALSLSWTVSDGSKLVQVTGSAQAPATSTPLGITLTTSPADNGKIYGVMVTAVDVAGNVAEARQDILVDRVGPRTNWSVAEGSRNVTGNVTLTFTEPVNRQHAVAGGYGGPITVEYSTDEKSVVFSDLIPDTSCGITLLGFTDRAGNPLEGATQLHFSTAPSRPANGAALATNVLWFEAVADDDGALSLFTAQSAGINTNYRWAKWESRDGGLETLWEDQGGPSSWQEAHLAAWREVESNLSATRRVSMSLLSRGPIDTHLSMVRPSGLAPDDTGAFAVVLPQALAGETAGAAPVGFASLNYFRTGTSSFSLNVRPSLVEARADRWHAVEVGNGTAKRQTFACGNPLLLTTNGCGPGAVVTQTGLESSPHYSSAVTDACLTEVFDRTDGYRHLVSSPVRCKDFQCGPPNDVTESTVEGLQVARDSTRKDSVLGARRRGNNIELLTRTLNASCAGSWTTLGSVNPGPTPGAFRPVVMGGVAALLYVDSSATLRVYVP